MSKLILFFIMGIIGVILGVMNIIQWKIPFVGLLFGIMSGYGITYSVVKHYLTKTVEKDGST